MSGLRPRFYESMKYFQAFKRVGKHSGVGMYICLHPCRKCDVKYFTYPGIRRGNKNSLRNENQKSRKKIISMEKKFYKYIYLKQSVSVDKLKVQN